MAAFLIQYEDGQVEGPITAAQLRSGVLSGEIAESSMIQSVGHASWHRAGTVRGLAPLFQEAAAARASRPRDGASEGPRDPPADAEHSMATQPERQRDPPAAGSGIELLPGEQVVMSSNGGIVTLGVRRSSASRWNPSRRVAS